MMQSLMKGDPDAREVIKQGFEGMMDQILPR
jgi:hypothetical protein